MSLLQQNWSSEVPFNTWNLELWCHASKKIYAQRLPTTFNQCLFVAAWTSGPYLSDIFHLSECARHSPVSMSPAAAIWSRTSCVEGNWMDSLGCRTRRWNEKEPNKCQRNFKVQYVNQEHVSVRITSIKTSQLADIGSLCQVHLCHHFGGCNINDVPPFPRTRKIHRSRAW